MSTRDKSEAARREFEKRIPPLGELFPASVTSGSSGLHAWTRQTFDTDGTRITDPNALAGTTTWMPARMPDGSTIATFPYKCWLRRACDGGNLGTVFEIIAPPATSTGSTVKILQVQSGATNAFGYPARVQQWNSTTGVLSDLSSTEVRVQEFNGVALRAGDYIDASLLLGANVSEDCYAGFLSRLYLYSYASGGGPYGQSLAFYGGQYTLGSAKIISSIAAGRYLLAGPVAVQLSGSGFIQSFQTLLNFHFDGGVASFTPVLGSLFYSDTRNIVSSGSGTVVTFTALADFTVTTATDLWIDLNIAATGSAPIFIQAVAWMSNLAIFRYQG